MITLKETIHVNQSQAVAFEYTSDFNHIQDWDPGVVSSLARDSRHAGVGSVFDLILKFGPFRPRMVYEIKEYLPHSKVVLHGRAKSFTAVDTIVFTRSPAGTRIDYRADINFLKKIKISERLLAPILINAGKTAVQGLQKALDRNTGFIDQKQWFSSGSSFLDYLADHMVIPGMLMFSRIGYQLSRRFWDDDSGFLYGKKVVITGGTSGIGKAAAMKLAEKKAILTIVARNREKARQVTQEIVNETGNPHVDYLLADLSLMSDIKQVAQQVKQTKKSIDVLINNAGALFNQRKETAEGFEQTLATDLLGIFYLTRLLKHCFPPQGGRIINVASGGMYTQSIDVDDLQNRQLPYSGTKAYARAKRGIVVLTQIWAAQMRHLNVAVHAMHPGWVDTPGIEQALPGFHSMVHSILRTPVQGADTIVWLAASKKAGECTGKFWLDRRPHETVIFPKTGVSEAKRAMLWKQLNRMTSPFETDDSDQRFQH